MNECIPPLLAEYRATITQCFPELWPEIEAALSTIAVLKLKDAANPVALIYEGDPASGKSTVVEMFKAAALAYHTDKFSPASFVSHSAAATRDQLTGVDLLPRIKHKLLLTPELGPMFAGKEDDLVERFTILTRVLDGRGLQTDSGVHGQRGYTGDYFFVWLGATTPIGERVWSIMGKLGSRFVMWKMNPTVEVTANDLIQSNRGLSYLDRLTRSMQATKGYLSEFFRDAPVRSITWDTGKDPEEVWRALANLSLLMAEMRSKPQHEPDDQDERDEFVPERREGPKRFYALLGELAQGHALVYGRRQLTEDDLPLVTRVTLSSMTLTHSTLFRALINAGGTLEVEQARLALGVSTPTARDLMRKLGQHRVFTLGHGVQGHAQTRLSLAPGWQWCLGLKGRF